MRYKIFSIFLCTIILTPGCSKEVKQLDAGIGANGDKAITHVGAPTGLQAKVTYNDVELEWNIRSDLIHGGTLSFYSVYRKPGECIPTSCFKKLATIKTVPYTDDSVKRGKQYVYGLTAVDRWGNESEMSETVSVKVP